MKFIFLVFGFIFGELTFCYGQNELNDCQILESVFKDSAVKKFLFSRSHFVGFSNEGRYFSDCHSVSVEGKRYKIYDSVETQALGGYPPIAIYIRKGETTGENPNSWYMILDSFPQEKGALIELRKENGKYVVQLRNIFGED